MGEGADITWKDGGVPVSARFDDPYFSLQDGLAETVHVFLDGNDLAVRLGPGFQLAELGFGTGLSFLATQQLMADRAIPGPVRFTSFEAFPMRAADMSRALAAFPTLAPLAADLTERWTGPGAYDFGDMALEVIAGDARRTLPRWAGGADAWFLDGFAPVRNPELWEPALLAEVARHTSPGGTFATYTAAGHVRRALSEAGFEVTRAPGYGRKRHMTRGRLR